MDMNECICMNSNISLIKFHWVYPQLKRREQWLHEDMEYADVTQVTQTCWHTHLHIFGGESKDHTSNTKVKKKNYIMMPYVNLPI